MRQERGLDEEGAAELLRQHGLTGWQAGTLSQVEAEKRFENASRGDHRLYAEAKGRTASVGLDVDTMYGQLLRRMPAEELGSAIFAVVVPDVAVKAAERVPCRIRAALGIEIYGVAEDGTVSHVGNHQDPASSHSIG